ncbi:MAG: 1-deoxy-D-xylulose-5-phosphate synthase [Bacteroidales bacterium]|nr:1-deoxy-D-xylulose-5-phosphate synthase [Bacteroidales bacterium]
MWLEKINTPDDLKKIPREKLPLLAEEIRNFLIEINSKHPGHLGANLGVVELSIALHYVFNSPQDKIIWDVGHQSYVHKILTGRKDRFHTLRQLGGISGFPLREESEHDVFGTGHSSTSLSAALGLAMGEESSQNHYIAVIGDGSFTAGQPFEALNNISQAKANILIILNDNGMSIDKNRTALAQHFTRITASHTYNFIKYRFWRFLKGTWLHVLITNLFAAIKWTWFKKANIFEIFGIRYFGPVDGHDIKKLIYVLKDLKDVPGPKVLHVLTVKGKGFKPAEKDQITYHSPGKFDIETGKVCDEDQENKPPKMHVVFGKTLLKLAETNPKIVAITPAMLTGSALTFMKEKFPDRVFDVGIAEQHAVTFAAGLALAGKIPYCTIYSTFLQRGYDQLIHDVALQRAPVVMCIDRGGLVGEDGATHQGIFDLAYLRLIPNIIIGAPMDEFELQDMLYTAQAIDLNKPFAIRYPRGEAHHLKWEKTWEVLPVGKAQLLHEGCTIGIATIGAPGLDVLSLYDRLEAKNISFTHYNMRFLKPIDQDALRHLCEKHAVIVTVEDGVIDGGLGSTIAEYIAEHNYGVRLIRLGVPDRFVEHGSIFELKEKLGYDANGIFRVILNEHLLFHYKKMNEPWQAKEY